METINDVPVLIRREIEALITVPLLEAFSQEFGWEKTQEIAEKAISKIAEASGREMAKAVGGNTIEQLNKVLPAFKNGGTLETELIRTDDECICMNVTKCQYAEMYQKHGLKKYGTLLSCKRDSCLFKGFNPQIEFTRTQTIMEGGACCDFCLKEHKNENVIRDQVVSP